MLYVCSGLYLILGLLVMFWLWAVLAKSRIQNTNEGHDRQRFYRIMLAFSRSRDAEYRKEFNLLEDTSSKGEGGVPLFNPHE